MRADRLIAALMLLQHHGKVTVPQLAEELEVSERTARRDLEALAMSGVPIYSQSGRGGGWFLVGGAKTDLTGLSADESRALFLAAGPALDSTPELKSALRKLTTALPETFREEATVASVAIKIDPIGWGQVDSGAGGNPDINELIDAVVASRRVEIDYESVRAPRGLRTVEPLGLVTKRGVWYLIATTARGRRTYRVSRILSIRVLDERFDRPADFDLDRAWDEITTDVEAMREGISVRAIADPSLLRVIQWHFRDRHTVHRTLSDGRIEVTLFDYHARSFVHAIAGYGNRIELVDPPEDLVVEMRRITAELADLYGPAETGSRD